MHVTIIGALSRTRGNRWTGEWQTPLEEIDIAASEDRWEELIAEAIDGRSPDTEIDFREGNGLRVEVWVDDPTLTPSEGCSGAGVPDADAANALASDILALVDEITCSYEWVIDREPAS